MMKRLLMIITPYAFFSHNIYFVKRLLDTAETKLGGAIKDPYYINIFTHILILLKRVGTVGTLPHPQVVEDYEYENRDIAHCVAMMIKQISEYLGKNVARDEAISINTFILPGLMVTRILSYRQIIGGRNR